MISLNELLALQFPEADFEKDILLSDHGDGRGIVISQWNLPEPLPTEQQLQEWSVIHDLAYRQKMAVSNRIYPTIQNQLDMIYHDMKNNTTNWVDTITQIKNKNPKPEI